MLQYWRDGSTSEVLPLQKRGQGGGKRFDEGRGGGDKRFLGSFNTGA